jgi:hypothetical protein
MLSAQDDLRGPAAPVRRPGPTFGLLKQLGVDDVKVFVRLNSLAPDPLSRTRPRFDASPPAAYPEAVWAPYDAIVRAAAARGIGLDLAVEAPMPLWATGPGVPPGPHRASWVPGSRRPWTSVGSSPRRRPATAADAAGRRLLAAAACGLLVDLERTELRAAAGAASDRRLDVEVSSIYYRALRKPPADASSGRRSTERG